MQASIYMLPFFLTILVYYTYVPPVLNTYMMGVFQSAKNFIRKKKTNIL